jgi:hypothetical protein
VSESSLFTELIALTPDWSGRTALIVSQTVLDYAPQGFKDLTTAEVRKVLGVQLLMALEAGWIVDGLPVYEERMTDGTPAERSIYDPGARWETRASIALRLPNALRLPEPVQRRSSL